jgi:tetratricopeptide (TPR) repeat protein
MTQISGPGAGAVKGHTGINARDPGEAFRHAEVLERSGHAAEAESIYRRLLQTHPEHPAVLHHLAVLVKRGGRLMEAEELARRGLAAEPREPALYNALGGILRAVGRLGEAETAYRKAIEIWNAFAEAHYNLGVVLDETGRAEEALASYRQAVALVPSFGKALTRIGATLSDRGARDEALETLERATSSAPELFDAHYYKGGVLSSLGRHEEALGALERAKALRPESFEAVQVTANVLREAGRLDDALAAYWKLIELRPDHERTHEEINKLAWMAGREDLYLRSFVFARERLGDLPGLLRLEAAFHLRRDAFTAAEPLLRKAKSLAPRRGDVLGLLARTLAGQGELQESYALFADAVRLEPADMRHWQEFGFALLRGKNPTEALKLFEHAHGLSPYDQIVLAGMSLAYRELGSPRYRELVDFEKYVRIYDIKPPAGFVDAAAFNEALAAELDALHTARAEPIDQTLRGGTQTTGRLLERHSPLLDELRVRIAAAVNDYIKALADHPAHPAGRAGLQRFRFSGSWSCRLASGGYHNNHVHPEGWISSAYYVRLPDMDDPSARHGWLKFGESNLELGERDQPDYFVRPAVGRLVLFPSFFWHGTVPFPQNGDRLTIAFDAVPVAWMPASQAAPVVPRVGSAAD